MRNLVVGTAGHIDHGKTALVRALTGVDTDTHKEEKERGISIDIGFASLELPSGQNIDIIDVPGHEKFVRNMLRGIFGVDMALLVIAADDGPMPQTREHLNILELLDVRYGMIVISKIDKVDRELLAVVEEEIPHLLKGTFMERSPVIHFSAKTAQGLDEIKSALDRMATAAREKEKDNLFRLPIDRVFNVKGFGTVATGTVASGSIRAGDEVQICPGKLKTRVRAIQVHRERVEEAEAGQRIGINLAGLETEQVERGMVLSEPDTLLPTRILNARLYYLKASSAPLVDRQKVKFYCGTTEQTCRVVLTDRDKMLPGTDSLVQLRLEKQVASLPFDRYVIRSLSPATTVGGGIILETLCKKSKSFDATTTEQLQFLESRDHRAVVEILTKRAAFRPLKLEELSQRCGLTRTATGELVKKLQAAGTLACVDASSTIHASSYEELKVKVVDCLKVRYQVRPLEINISKEELRTRISPSLDPRLYDQLLQDLSHQGTVAIDGSKVRLSTYTVKLKAHQERFCREIESMCSRERCTPLWPSDIDKLSGKIEEKETDDLLRLLAFQRKIVILGDGSIINSEALEKAKMVIEEELSNQEGLTLSELKNLLGIGRRAAQSIMEYLDEIGFTRRLGEVRMLR
jgi:selenocysteine-specific elongation factor